MWLASVWSFVFQTAKEAGAEGKHSATADAEIIFLRFIVEPALAFMVNLSCFVNLLRAVYVLSLQKFP